MRQLDDYYTEYIIRGRDLDEKELSITRVLAYFGIRLQTTFMSNGSFYKGLGFETKNEVIQAYKKSKNGSPTLLKIRRIKQGSFKSQSNPSLAYPQPLNSPLKDSLLPLENPTKEGSNLKRL